MEDMPAFEDVRIVEVPDIRVGLLEHRGDPATIEASLARFIGWRKLAHLHPSTSATYNIWYTDPRTTPAAAFRVGLAAATERGVEANDAGVVASVIPGGRCAVLRRVGTDAAVGRAANFLYAEWLPRSDETMRDFPPYSQRVTMVPDVAADEAITDIYLPLQ